MMKQEMVGLQLHLLFAGRLCVGFVVLESIYFLYI